MSELPSFLDRDALLIELKQLRARRLELLFWLKVQLDPVSGCWLWTGSTTDGYGNLTRDNKTIYAHRLTYETLVGPVPEGLDLDHLCRIRRCVNPDHMEPVTRRINILRGYRSREREAITT